MGRHRPEYRGGTAADVTVYQLLTHTSGLPGQVPLYRSHPTRAELLRALGELPRRARYPVEYSSQGFILLGLVAEAAAGRPLDELVADLVCAPLGMTGTVFAPDVAGRAQAVATERCPWRGRTVVGEVHDENAVVLGGVCGHAGLFAPLSDLERLGRALAGGGRALLRPDTFALMTAPHTDALELRRCLAWQGQDRQGSPVGRSFSSGAYGHTGFTGTSIWPWTRRPAAMRCCSRTGCTPPARHRASRRSGTPSTTAPRPYRPQDGARRASVPPTRRDGRGPACLRPPPRRQ